MSLHLVSSSEFEDLIAENYVEPGDSTEPVTVSLKCPVDGEPIVVLEYDIENDGGDELLHNGSYNRYSLDGIGVRLGDHEVVNYYKVCLETVDYRTVSHTPWGNVHLFEFPDGHYRRVSFALSTDATSSTTLRTRLLSVEEFERLAEAQVEYDVIGFSQGKLLCAYHPAGDADPDDDPIVSLYLNTDPETWFAHYHNFDADTQIIIRR